MQDIPPFHTPSSTTSPGTPFAFTLTTAVCAMRALKRGTIVAFSHMFQCASNGVIDVCLDFIETVDVHYAFTTPTTHNTPPKRSHKHNKTFTPRTHHSQQVKSIKSKKGSRGSRGLHVYRQGWTPQHGKSPKSQPQLVKSPCVTTSPFRDAVNKFQNQRRGPVA